MSHKMVHVELSANDTEKAAHFYSTVFGWKMTQYPDLDYTTFMPSDDSNLGGGFTPVSADSPAGTILVYIETDDIEESFAKIEANGGQRLQPPMEIPGVGTIATFKDPTGNLMALIKPSSEMLTA